MGVIRRPSIRGRGRGDRGRGGRGRGRGVATSANAIPISASGSRPRRGDSRQQNGDIGLLVATSPNNIPIMASDKQQAAGVRYQRQAGNHITNSLVPLPPNHAHADAGAASSSRHAGSGLPFPSASSSSDSRLHPYAHPAHRQGEHEGVGYNLAARDNNTGAPAAAALAARLTRLSFPKSNTSAFGGIAEPSGGADWFPRGNHSATRDWEPSQRQAQLSEPGVFGAGAPFTRRAGPSQVQPNALAVGDNATSGPSHEGRPDPVTRSNRGDISSTLDPIKKNKNVLDSAERSSSNVQGKRKRKRKDKVVASLVKPKRVRIVNPKRGRIVSPPKRKLPTSAAVLGTPDEDIINNSGVYVNKFQFKIKHVQAARDYLTEKGRLFHLKDVFEWWFIRVIDRLDRKLAGKFALDPHETVISQLQDRISSLRKIRCATWHKSRDVIPVFNYYAVHIVPANGFTPDQIRIVRDQKDRWDKRDKQEKELLEKDPTGKLLDEWKIESVTRARERQHAKHRKQSSLTAGTASGN
jgi:hypothetical protein